MKSDTDIEKISNIVLDILGKEELIYLIPRIDPTTSTINTKPPFIE
ncbi:hypothetical protein WIW89_00050 [Stygiolobus sp. CP850M]